MSSTSYPVPTTERQQSGRHPVNVGHLVMGVAFLGLVGVWALFAGDVIADDHVRWFLPVPWVLAGLAGLLAVGLSSSRRWSTRQTGWVGAERPDAERLDQTTDDTVAETPDTTDETTEENR